VAPVPTSSFSDNLQSQLAILDKQRQLVINTRQQGHVEASDTAGAAASDNLQDSGSASLLKRAKAAEAKVEMLKKQLIQVLHANTSSGAGSTEATADTAEVADSSVSVAVAGGKGKPATGGRAKGGADPAEIRKLQRQIKDLESKLSTAENSGGGTDKKAAAAAEKAQAKKLKDMEKQFQKEKAQLESRAIKAEGALETATATMPLITEERDSLRAKVKELSDLVVEMGALREQAARGVELQQLLSEREAELTLIQEQFKKETFLRKKYKNELEDLKGNIRVYARCRPFAQYELEKKCATCVTFPDDSSVKVATSRGEKLFEFDTAFTPTSTQVEVFEDTKRLVESCIDGYNVCLFAYGQTGSGKTHTMTGNSFQPGITPSAITELFRLKKEKAHCNISVSTYFVELYNDNLVDLYWSLDNDRKKSEPPKLIIKMDEKKMVFIQNTTIKEVSQPAELMELFELGNAQRHTGATRMNAESSRSHSIFAIMVSSIYMCWLQVLYEMTFILCRSRVMIETPRRPRRESCP
jgi:hypothetical protein